MFNLSKNRRGFVSLTIVILSVFFVTIIVAMNTFSSQMQYSNERNIIEKQVYYNAYAGLQKAIFEITQNKNVSIADYFSLDDNLLNVDPKNQKYYTHLKVKNSPNDKVYVYDIESIGYGKFRQDLLSKKISAKITVDYVEKNGIIRVDNIKIQ